MRTRAPDGRLFTALDREVGVTVYVAGASYDVLRRGGAPNEPAYRAALEAMYAERRGGFYELDLCFAPDAPPAQWRPGAGAHLAAKHGYYAQLQRDATLGNLRLPGNGGDPLAPTDDAQLIHLRVMFVLWLRAAFLLAVAGQSQEDDRGNFMAFLQRLLSKAPAHDPFADPDMRASPEPGMAGRVGQSFRALDAALASGASNRLNALARALVGDMGALAKLRALAREAHAMGA